jgi:hypothetical protein
MMEMMKKIYVKCEMKMIMMIIYYDECVEKKMKMNVYDVKRILMDVKKRKMMIQDELAEGVKVEGR